MKIDVEGAEWESFLAAPDDVLEQIDQLAVEFHGMPEEKHLAVVERLRQFFHVAHVHFNNFACTPGIDPSRVAARPHASDAPNHPQAADCQPTVR